MQTPPPLLRPPRQRPPGRQFPHAQTPPSETATAADGTHSTGMHSCYHLLLDIAEFFRINMDIHFILQQLELWSLKNNSTVIVNGLFCCLLLIACYFWCGTMRSYISFLWKSTFIVFFKCFGGHQSFLWGHWDLCFGLLVTSTLGFLGSLGWFPYFLTCLLVLTDKFRKLSKWWMLHMRCWIQTRIILGKTRPSLMRTERDPPRARSSKSKFTQMLQQGTQSHRSKHLTCDSVQIGMEFEVVIALKCPYKWTNLLFISYILC